MKPLTHIIFLIAALAITRATCADIYVEATAPPAREITRSYFGVHFHRIQVLPTEQAVPTQWPEVSFGHVRLWDTVTRWGDITPRPGRWDFQRMDAFVDFATTHGADVLYTLGSTPQWASARPNEPCPYGQGCGAEPVRMAHWEEYVRRVAQRYAPRISYFELWNEPNFSDFHRDQGQTGFYTGSVAQMVAMARSARMVLDEIAPKALLCTPGFVNGPDRLEKFLSEGGAKHVQAVCYHFYSESSDHFAKQVNTIRAIMKRTGVEQLPLWNTEAGVDTLRPDDLPSGIAARSKHEALARLSQMLILGAAANMDRFYYYAWDNTRSGMVNTAGEKLPGHDMLKKLQSWLIGAVPKGCRSQRQLVVCEMQKSSGRFWIVWASSPTETTLTLAPGLKVLSSDLLFGQSGARSVKISKEKIKTVFDSIPIQIEIGH